MSAVLNTNMASLYAQQNLSTAQSDLATSVQRLSSGKQINSAADNAAGFAVSQAITATKNQTDQSISNTQDAISMVQTASGALDVVGQILQRALTLATQKADGSLTTQQTASINSELTSLYQEIGQIKSRTIFQGGSTSLFGQSLSFQTGAGNSTANISIADLSLGQLAGGNIASTVAVGISTTLNANSPVGSFKSGTSTFTIQVADPTGALAAAGSNGTSLMVSVNGAPSTALTASTITNWNNGNVTIALNGTSAATAGATYSFTALSNAPITLGTDATSVSPGNTAAGAQFTVTSTTVAANLAVGQKVYDLTTGVDTGATIASISSSNVVTLTPGTIGATDKIAFGNVLNANSSSNDLMNAVQVNAANQAVLGTWNNRLNYAVSNMQTLSNNLASAVSQIVDTNYAAETAKLTRGQILQQAATSMLAQANQMPNVILTLLK